MRRLVDMAGLGLVLVVAGCVPSVHPLYTEKDLVFEPALVGEWSEKDSLETWTFTKNGDKEYKLVYVDEKGKKGEFEVHLLKVQGKLFLDLFPEDPELEQNDFYKAHLMPVHTFMKVQAIKPTLQMAPLQPEWAKKFLKEHPTALRHEKVHGRVLLTAPTKDLQAFVLKHEETKDAWGDLSNMVRKVKQ